MLVERFQEAAALAALDEPHISSRICVSVKPGDGNVYRMVNDTVERTVNGAVFAARPIARFSPITTGAGQAADTMVITLDSGDYANDPGDIENIFQGAIAYALRDRPIQVGEIVLDPETHAIVGLIPRFVGLVDSVHFNRSPEDGATFEVSLISFRAVRARREPRVYGDVDQNAAYPGDNSMRFISDAVVRNGKYKWNGTEGGGRASGGGGTFNPVEGPGFSHR